MVRRSARTTGFAAVIVLVLAGCQLVDASPSARSTTASSGPASAPPASLVPSPSPTPASTLQPGGLVVTAIATDNEFTNPRWAPDGRAFAVTVGWGRPINGSAEIYAADGATRLATFPGGGDVAWLDASTFALFETSIESVNGSVTVRSLSGAPEIVASSTSGGFLGTGTSRLAILDPFDADPSTPVRFRVFGQGVGSRPGDKAWPVSDEIEGQPIVWSNDASLLLTFVGAEAAASGLPQARTVSTHEAAHANEPVLGAGASPRVRLVVRRYPGGAVVPTPDVLFEARAVWVFSPDGRFLAGGGVTKPTSVIDLVSGRFVELPRAHAGWTPTGELALLREGAPASLWHPDGSITETSLPLGVPTFGPLPGEAFITPPCDVGVACSATVQIGSKSATIPLLPNAPFATAFWAPDGTACYVTTATDDAQLLHSTLYRVTAP